MLKNSWGSHRSETETDEYKDSISLVIHSINALRGDMKAAILAASKIGIFSHDDYLGWEKEKTVKNKSKGGKHKPAEETDKIIYQLGKDLPKYNRDHKIRLAAKEVINNPETDNLKKELLQKIRNMKKGYVTKRYKIAEKRIKSENK